MHNSYFNYKIYIGQTAIAKKKRKMSKGYSNSTGENKLATAKKIKTKTTVIYCTQLKIDQHKIKQNPGMLSGAPEE